MEYTKKECGCRVVHAEHLGRVLRETEIIYCRLHKAAPTMYKALSFISPVDFDKLMPSTQEYIRQALIEAKGGK